MEAILAGEIKAFRKQFRSRYGRDPSRKDMARYPDIASTYDAWSKLKSKEQLRQKRQTEPAVPSPSSSSYLSSKLKPEEKPLSSLRSSQNVLASSSNHKPSDEALDNFSSTSSLAPMAPPPTTPSKKHTKARGSLLTPKQDPFPQVRTPVRRKHYEDGEEANSAIHDSGGSIIDVAPTPPNPIERLGEDVDDEGEELRGSPSTPSTQRAIRMQFQKPHNQAGPSSSSGPLEPYADGSSPTKLRTLIASFAATRQNTATTPTKLHPGSPHSHQKSLEKLRKAPHAAAEADDDDRLSTLLKTSRKDAAFQNGSLFTPRTKARKRLRGEVVITPRKALGLDQQREVASELRELGTLVKSSGTEDSGNATKRPTKRQRSGGIATLMQYGIVPINGPQSKLHGATMKRKGGSAGHKESMQRSGTSLQLRRDGMDAKDVDSSEEDDQSDDDDDLLGPSPSAQRVVHLVGPGFRPLLQERVDGKPVMDAHRSVDEMDLDEMPLLVQARRVSGSESPAVAPNENKKDCDVVEDEGNDEDDEDRHIPIRTYQRFEDSSSVQRIFEADEDGEEYASLSAWPLPASTSGQHRRSLYSEALSDSAEEEDNTALNDNQNNYPSFNSLTLTSPQGKKALYSQRRRQAKELRNLLAPTNVLASDDEEDDAAEQSNATENNQKTSKAKGQAQSTRMMRGALTKAARRKLALQEAAEEQKGQEFQADGRPNTIPMANGSRPDPARGKKGEVSRDEQFDVATTRSKARLIFRRGREDDPDDEAGEDFEDHFDSIGAHPYSVHASDEEQWASDIDSDEYGLGDGIMDESDVI